MSNGTIKSHSGRIGGLDKMDKIFGCLVNKILFDSKEKSTYNMQQTIDSIGSNAPKLHFPQKEESAVESSIMK